MVSYIYAQSNLSLNTHKSSTVLQEDGISTKTIKNLVLATLPCQANPALTKGKPGPCSYFIVR